jgi:hypothetical protein
MALATPWAPVGPLLKNDLKKGEISAMIGGFN